MKTPTTSAELSTLIDGHFRDPKAEPLILPGLSEQLYRNATGVNVSALKPLAESPKKYRYAQENPKEQTAAMIFGTVVHAMALEPDSVPSMIVTRPDKWKDWRTNEAKDWRAQQTALVVTKEDLAEMEGATNAIRSHPKAGWILSRADKEVAVWRRHERTGLILKGRLDMPFRALDETTAVADIKKTVSVKKELFEKAIGERLYHMQGAFYVDLIGASSFYFVTVEEEPPHDADVFELDPSSLSEGRRLYEALLDRLVKCITEDRWPGRGEETDTIEKVSAPRWAYTAETIGA